MANWTAVLHSSVRSRTGLPIWVPWYTVRLDHGLIGPRSNWTAVMVKTPTGPKIKTAIRRRSIRPWAITINNIFNRFWCWFFQSSFLSLWKRLMEFFLLRKIKTHRTLLKIKKIIYFGII